MPKEHFENHPVPYGRIMQMSSCRDFTVREHPFSTYARRGGGGVGQKRTQYYEFISDSDVILRTRGGEGVKKYRNFAYVLNGCSPTT